MLFAISAFTVISLSVGVMFDLIRKIVEYGLPILQALQALIYSLPSFLVLSFPMAVLLSTLLSYGKLSAQWEHTIVVLKDGIEILTDRDF